MDRRGLAVGSARAAARPECRLLPDTSAYSCSASRTTRSALRAYLQELSILVLGIRRAANGLPCPSCEMALRRKNDPAVVTVADGRKVLLGNAECRQRADKGRTVVMVLDRTSWRGPKAGQQIVQKMIEMLRAGQVLEVSIRPVPGAAKLLRTVDHHSEEACRKGLHDSVRSNPHWTGRCLYEALLFHKLRGKVRLSVQFSPVWRTRLSGLSDTLPYLFIGQNAVGAAVKSDFIETPPQRSVNGDSSQYPIACSLPDSLFALRFSRPKSTDLPVDVTRIPMQQAHGTGFSPSRPADIDSEDAAICHLLSGLFFLSEIERALRDPALFEAVEP